LPTPPPDGLRVMKLCCRRPSVACNNAHVRTVSPGPLLGRRNATRRWRFGDVGHRSTEHAQRPGRAGFAAAGADTEPRSCVRNAPALPRSPSPTVSPLTPSLLPHRPVAQSAMVGRRTVSWSVAGVKRKAKATVRRPLARSTNRCSHFGQSSSEGATLEAGQAVCNCVPIVHLSAPVTLRDPAHARPRNEKTPV
jgi:hypothetical protein